MATALTGTKPGGVTPTFTWLLHTSGVDFGTGLVVGDGAGNDSALWLADDAIGVMSATANLTKLISEATATREIRLTDQVGRLYPEEIRSLTADVTSTIITSTLVPNLEIQPAQAGWYVFELIAIVQSAATTTGVKLYLTGPPEAGSVVWQSEMASSAVAKVLSSGTALPIALENTATYVANADVIAMFRGYVRFATVPTAPFTIGIASEIAASQVILRAGSMFRIKRLGAP